VSERDGDSSLRHNAYGGVVLCVLQCVAVCCSVLQCVAVCCTVSQYVWMRCNVEKRESDCVRMCVCMYVCMYV